MLLKINGKFTMGKLKSSLLLQSFVLNRPHCQFRGVCQGIKQTYLYLWYPLFPSDAKFLLNRRNQAEMTIDNSVADHAVSRFGHVTSAQSTSRRNLISYIMKEISFYLHCCQLESRALLVTIPSWKCRLVPTDQRST